MPAQRLARASSNVEAKKSAAELDREARSEAERLKSILAVQPPWSREVEQCRQRCRDLHLLILFAHSLSPYAQSLDQIWHHTSYLLIAAYRDLIGNIERTLPPPAAQSSGSRSRRGGGERGGSASKDERSQVASDLKKAATRFRQALSTEETFYKSLIGRIVNFHNLAQVGDTASYLAEARIPLGDNNDEGDVKEISGTDQEKRDKLALVYKGLICLGDLERYKEQYKEPSKSRRGRDNQRQGGGGTGPEEKYGAAKRYYEIARGLQPDDGSAFNQLAVISTYQSNDFCTTYYYFRALAIRNAFKGADGILYKFFGKTFERWRAHTKESRAKEGGDSGDDEEDGVKPDEVREWKEELVVLVGILYLKAGFTFISSLQPSVLETLSALLKARRLSAEVIVKTMAIVIGSHYRARSTMGLEQAPKQIQRSLEAEKKALALLLGVFEVLMRVGAEEVEEARSTLGDESALALEGEEEVGDQLPQFISAVLRRILPSLRIVSKWIKLNLEYLGRHTSLPAFTSFWATYRRFIDAVGSVFPIDRLPSLPEPMEEDIDMRGFMPLQRGITNGTSNGTGALDGAGMQGEVHPNEQQLMRLADLQVDAKLISQRRAGANLGGGPDVLIPPTSTFVNVDVNVSRYSDEADMASVSTETEDDPVNLAMRATLGAESSVDGEEEREAEPNWDQGDLINVAAPLPDNGLSPYPASSGLEAGLASNRKPTAYDLLQNLMLESTPTPPAQQPSLSHMPTGTPSPVAVATSSPHGGPPTAGHSPSGPGPGAGTAAGSGLLFGAAAGGPASLGPSGGSIWTMTREESAKGQKRASAGNLASIWGNPPTTGEATHAPSLFGAPQHVSSTTMNDPSSLMPPPASDTHTYAPGHSLGVADHPAFGGVSAQSSVQLQSQHHPQLPTQHHTQQPRTQHNPLGTSALWDFSRPPLPSSSSPSAFPPTNPAYPYDSIQAQGQGHLPYYAQPAYLSSFSGSAAGGVGTAGSPGTTYSSPHGFTYGYGGVWTGSGEAAGQGGRDRAGYGRPP
ncbi:hypothetical protein IAU59_001008 [Kwoniella sp. CBS 9459]